MEKVRVFEAFAGIGAQRKALEILRKNKVLDYEIVGTSEWDIWANIAYNSIHYDNKNIARNLSNQEINSFLNIFELSNDSKNIVRKNFIERLSRYKRELLYSSIVNSNNLGSILNITGDSIIEKKLEIDLFTYSFPCQDLSVAGSIHGFNKGMAKGGKTRSGLLWEIERLLKELKLKNKLPKYLLLENVRNMLSEKHRADYMVWINFLHSIGYNTQTYLLDSIDYGIPQSRKRVFALSVFNGDENNFHDTLELTGNILEKNLPKNISVELGIDKQLFEIINTNYNNEKYSQEAVLAIPNRTSSRLKMFEDNYLLCSKSENLIRKRKVVRNNVYKKYKNYNYLSFCRTITTKQDRNPNAGIIDLTGTKLEKLTINGQQKANYRFLTNLEVFRLMGFEEEDFFKVKNTNIFRKEVLYRQAGNSIVVNVLVAIFAKLFNNKKKNER